MIYSELLQLHYVDAIRSMQNKQ